MKLLSVVILKESVDDLVRSVSCIVRRGFPCFSSVSFLFLHTLQTAIRVCIDSNYIVNCVDVDTWRFSCVERGQSTTRVEIGKEGRLPWTTT